MRVSNRIAVTGANGFLGKAVVARLVEDGHKVTTLTRRPHKSLGAVANVEIDLVKGIQDSRILTGQDIVIHLAGSVTGGTSGSDPAASDNAIIARNLAKGVREAKVPHLLVLSSLMAKTAEQQPDAVRAYGREKAAADKAVLDELSGRQQRVIFLRPPAVYGAGMRGSLATLTKLIRKGVPLPLGLAKTPRPYLSLRNLADLVSAIAQLDPDAWAVCDHKFLEMHDGELVATTDLVQTIGQIIGKPARMFPVPAALLYLVAKPLGKTSIIVSAFAQPFMTPTDDLNACFGWIPSETMPESLGFLKNN